jgi:hypothetical protein
LKVFIAVLDDMSVAVHVTTVAPSGKVWPEAGKQVGVTGPSTASAAEAV